MSVLTTEERLRSIDESVEEVKERLLQVINEGFGAAVEELAQSEEVDSRFEDRLADVAGRLRALPDKLEPTVFENEPLHELHTTLHETRDLMQELREETDGSRLDVLNELLIRVERIRHIVRDAIDEHVTGIGTDTGRVLEQLDDWLPNTAQHEVARLVGVNRRTLMRWSQQPARPRRRLQLVAQIVAILRHSWTEEGVLAWFDRPNRELDDRKPRALLDEPAYERDLLMAARSTRAQYGT